MNPRSRCHGAAWAAAFSFALGLASGSAEAQSYQVEASAYGQLEPGVGLVVLDASGEVDPRISAQAVVFGGYDTDAGEADVLLLALRFRDLEGRAEARLGRLMIQSGALRPLHIDGAYAAGRGPGALRLEAFVGSPVVAEFADRPYDWVVGTRLSRALGDYGAVGVAYAFMRDDGQRADQEVAFDLGVHLADGLDFNSKLAVDVFTPGIAEALATLAYRKGIYRGELFFSDRDPSRMLPSNSLFTVLGAYSSMRVGGTFGVRAAPRLDLRATGAVRLIDLDPYESVLLEGLLRLDDEGKSSVSLGGRREGAPDGSWTGLRGAARVRLVEDWAGAVELELVVPDHPQGRGKVWPWGRLGVQWVPEEHWQVDLAMQASTTPQYRYVLDALGRLTYRIGGP